jgi:hypothetical protein
MRSRTRALALILLAGTASTSLAQPGTDTESPFGTDESSEPAPPPPPPEPTPPPPPPARPAPVEAQPEPGSAPLAGRPEGLSFGIGIGYTLPTSIQTPNTTSVRMRLPSGLTFEPLLTLGNQKTTSEAGGASVEDARTELALAALVRFPVVRRGKFELEVLGGAGFGTIKDNPDGPDNNTTTSGVNLNWGLAVSYWLTPHWNLTFSARNPLVSYNKTTNQQPAPAPDTSTSTSTVALEFAPIVSAMIHLYN